MKSIKTLEELAKEAKEYKALGKKIGLCHGSYDVLHAGHIEHFTEAKKICDILYVTITADKYILKHGKPVLSSERRAKHLLHLSCVEGVAIVNDYSAVPAIEAVKPDFYIKGKEYENLNQDATKKIYKEKDTVEKNGGALYFTSDKIVFSSTKIQAEQGVGPYIPLDLNISLEEVRDALAKMRTLKVAVLGELITDRWTSVEQTGVSSKALCPAVHTTLSVNQVGGSGAVARHIANFVKEIRLFSNRSSEKIPKNIAFEPIDDGKFIITRYWVPSESKRLFEKKDITIKEMKKSYIKKIERYKPDILIIADFGNGLISYPLAKEIIDYLSGKLSIGIMVQANSSNFGFNRLDKYSNADLYVFDEREANLLLGHISTNVDDLLMKCSEKLQFRKNKKKIYITRGRHGASLLFGSKSKHKILNVPNLVRSTIDTIGCGDAFYSLACLCHAANISPKLSLKLANMAGAVCTQWLCNENSITPQHLLDVAKVVE